MKPHQIILDMDNGLGLPVTDTDDALALALALASPEIALLGITTCAGNCTTAQSTYNTLTQLSLANRQEIAVAEGRADPLLRCRATHFDYLEKKRQGRGARFWQQLPPPAPPPPDHTACPLKAHELMMREIRRHPYEVTLVATGSLTNLALALLIDPALAGLIKGVVHMGGAFTPTRKGDAPLVWQTPDIPAQVWRDTLRFNPLFDPEAAAIVCLSGVPLTLVPVNVTAQVFQRPQHVALLAETASPFHQHLHRYALPWVCWSMADRRLPGAHLHDPLTLALVVRPELARYRQMWVDVDRLLRLEDPWLREMPMEMERRGVLVRVAVAVDAEASETWINARIAGRIAGCIANGPSAD